MWMHKTWSEYKTILKWRSTKLIQALLQGGADKKFWWHATTLPCSQDHHIVKEKQKRVLQNFITSWNKSDWLGNIIVLGAHCFRINEQELDLEDLKVSGTVDCDLPIAGKTWKEPGPQSPITYEPIIQPENKKTKNVKQSYDKSIGKKKPKFTWHVPHTSLQLNSKLNFNNSLYL